MVPNDKIFKMKFIDMTKNVDMILRINFVFFYEICKINYKISFVRPFRCIHNKTQSVWNIKYGEIGLIVQVLEINIDFIGFLVFKQ